MDVLTVYGRDEIARQVRENGMRQIIIGMLSDLQAFQQGGTL